MTSRADHPQAGFTLIEALAAMALMGLKLWELASLALPMLTNAPGIC